MEYSANLTVNSKHILKLCKGDTVHGLLTKEQLEDKEGPITKITLAEKQQLFIMGFILGVEHEQEEPTDDEEPLIRHKATSRSTDDVNTLVVQGAGSRNVDEVQQLDISGTAGLPNGIDWTPAYEQVASKLSHISEKYDNKKDRQLMQMMGESHGFLEVVRHEIEQGCDKHDDRYDAFQRILGELEEQHKRFSAQHYQRFHTLEPHHLVLEEYVKVAHKNKDIVISDLLEDVLEGAFGSKACKTVTGGSKAMKDSKKKQKRIRHVTVQTDEE